MQLKIFRLHTHFILFALAFDSLVFRADWKKERGKKRIFISKVTPKLYGGRWGIVVTGWGLSFDCRDGTIKFYR